MMNCNRYRNYNTGRSGCGNGSCAALLRNTPGNGKLRSCFWQRAFVGGEGINNGNGVSPANTGSCFYTPAAESSRYTPTSGDCL